MAALRGFPAGYNWMDLLPARFRKMIPVFFVEDLDFDPLPASATRTGNIQIQDDAHVAILYTTAVVTDTLNTTRLTFVPQLVTISDTASGASFMNTPAHFHNIFGSAEQPAYWQQPRVLTRGSTMTVQLQNLEATARNVRLSFCGAKLYESAGWLA